MNLADLAPFLLSDSDDGSGKPNILGIPAGAFACFMLGWLWYSPFLFGKPWLRRVTKNGAQLGKMWKAMTVTVISLLLAATGMYYIVLLEEPPSVLFTAGIGGALGLLFVATSLATAYAYQGRGFVLWLIDASYQVACLVIIAAILGAWHR